MDPIMWIGAMLTGLGLLIGAGKAVVKEVIKDEPPPAQTQCMVYDPQALQDMPCQDKAGSKGH